MILDHGSANLTDNRKAHLVQTCRALKEQPRTDSHFFSEFIFGDRFFTPWFAVKETIEYFHLMRYKYNIRVLSSSSDHVHLFE